LDTGDHLGPYEVVRLLGRGGMGEVYLANHLALGRQAAVKVLPMEFGEQDRKRLKREGQAAARLQHPCIATFHELLEIDKVTALAMEYVPGPTLRERLGEGPLPTALAVAIAVCLLEALAHAHAAGIIHRDIKPEISSSQVNGPPSFWTSESRCKCGQRSQSPPKTPRRTAE
jgi:serine/threonine-protein kinase